MKFAVERDNLLHALAHAHRIVARTDAIPILSTVLMVVRDGRVAIKATSTEMVAETACPAEVEEPGEFALPLAPLVELMRKMPAGTPMGFSAEAGAGEVSIRYRRSSFSLPILATDAFPLFALTGDVFEMDIEAAHLGRLVEVPAHIADASSPWAHGVGVHVHFSTEGKSLVGVATDLKRMTIVTLPAEGSAAEFPPITIALKPIGEIVKLSKEAKGTTLRLRVSDRLLSVSDGSTTLTTKLIDVQFPDYTRVVPSETLNVAVIAADELGSALQRAMILADDKDRIVRCEIADGILSISARGQKSGAIQESIEVEGGNGTRFGFNARMAAEALNAISADVIELSSSGAGAPIVMRARSNAEVLCLVMPLKV